MLAERAAAACRLVYEATGNTRLRNTIAMAYRALELKWGRWLADAMRSSATAGDLRTTSFAVQQESFSNMRGAQDVIEACRRVLRPMRPSPGFCVIAGQKPTLDTAYLEDQRHRTAV